jgi:hypothetical protein
MESRARSHLNRASNYCTADPRGISLPNIARWDWNPSKSPKQSHFFPFSADGELSAAGDPLSRRYELPRGERAREPFPKAATCCNLLQCSLGEWIERPHD